MPIIGIDLGTTNSLVAWFTENGPQIIPNSFGEHLTPSVVSVDDDGEILTGKIAAERKLTAPEKTASVFKRSMGSKREFTLGDRSFLPEELSSFIIKKLKEDAERHLGVPIEEAIISTPAYFSDAQRRATKTAGELAGLKVERIVSEPTAAAIAYGLHETQAASKYLIFDLGGGTFDVSILEYTGNIMEVRAVAGDNFLGGEDFTEVLIGMFLAHHGINPDRLSPRHAAALYKSAETAKLAFSKSKQVTMRVSLPAGMIRREVTDLNETTAGEPAVPLPAEDFTDQAADGFTGRAAEEPARLRSLDEPLRKIVNPDETAADEPVCHTADKAADPLPEDNESNCLLEMELTLSEYEKRCEIVLARLKAPVVRALSDASVRLSDVDAIVLVGGATKLPIVRSFVSKLFGRIPSVGIDPDEAVALGAAVQAAMKERHAYIKELLLTDVCPYTLGTDVAIKRPDGLLESGNFAPIIERNSIIPASRVERFYTVRDNQRAVDIDILQGENRKAKDNIFLGSLKIPLPAGPAGSEAVDVRYTYDINGILEVEVTSVSSGKVEKKIIEKNPGAMSQDEIQGRFKDLSSLKIHPRENDAYKYLLEKGERLYQEHTGDKRQMIANAIQNFETALDKQERSAINAAAEALRELFSQVEEFEL